MKITKESLTDLFESFNETVAVFLKDRTNERTLRLTNNKSFNSDLWLKINTDINQLISKWESIRNMIQQIEGFFEGINEVFVRAETSFELIEDNIKKIHKALIERPENYVFWLESDRNFESVSVTRV